MKHILVTTDFSEEAEAAFDYAKEQVQLIGKEKSKITLLKVIDVVIPTKDKFEYGVANDDKKNIIQRIHKQASERIKEIAQKHFSGFPIETFVFEPSKDVYQGIIEFAEAHNVNLIVMSTHGRTGVGHFLLGSIAERVVRQSPCPVMVVPARIAKKETL
ncbi:MAG: universal stress protein-binding protein [Candidatus Scalindua rubra]|uniref:Universal stress protein-binding protein n=1 Tax=Candidatus Scalindua rubra TaxID=1872076 RepID=A0A1E3XA50_9BACT|nr:MAG: universal stress protein-binding protein [Candidatus Scalindua rubra]